MYPFIKKNTHYCFVFDRQCDTSWRQDGSLIPTTNHQFRLFKAGYSIDVKTGRSLESHWTSEKGANIVSDVNKWIGSRNKMNQQGCQSGGQGNQGQISSLVLSPFPYLSSHQEARTTFWVVGGSSPVRWFSLRLTTPVILIYCKLALKPIITLIENAFLY